MSQAHESVTEVLGDLDELAATQDHVSIGDVLDDFGGRSFGPFLMLPAMLEISPVGGIPGVPSFLALIIALTAIQLLIGREHVWLPMFIQRRAVSGLTLHRAVRRLRGIADWLDRHSEGRLVALTEGVWTRLVALIILALCCTVPLLEFLPFASSVPMVAILVLGLALTVSDGALVLAALVFAALAAATGAFVLSG